MRSEAGELVEDVAGDEHGYLPLAVEPQYELAHLDYALRVEAVHRLVEDEEIRPAAERHGDAEPLLHAEGEVARLLFARVRKAHEREQLVYALKARQAEDAVLLPEILPRAHVEIDARRLHHRAHAAAGEPDVAAGELPAVDAVSAGCGPLKPADEADERGLARAVAAHDAVDGALRYVHAQPAESPGLAVALDKVICA